MPQYIIHKDGAYNLYSTIVDAPIFEHALTLQQLEEYVRFEQGQHGINALPARLERAHRTGSSCLFGSALEEEVSCNRAGPDESRLPFDEFVQRFLTLPDRITTSTPEAAA